MNACFKHTDSIHAPSLPTDPCAGDAWRALATDGGPGGCDERWPGVRDGQLR